MAPSIFTAASFGLAISAARAAYTWPEGYTWPNEQTDFLEGMVYEHVGVNSLSPAIAVLPCPGTAIGAGRNTAAEWLRTAYHDMATADVEAGTGGIDASIGFELDRDENPGSAFNEALTFFGSMFSPRSSMSDLIALGAIQVVGGCSGGVIDIQFRSGRVDATGPGPNGVPTPEQDIDSHTSAFARQGFNESEMIGLVACGHTIGGVHGVDFPDIVDVTLDDNTQNFDGTTGSFDNSVAAQFVAGDPQNPLAFGHNVEKQSDARIFNSDGGALIGQMASNNSFFLATCGPLLERMVNTVPKEVNLSQPLQFIPVKPDRLAVSVGSDGNMTVSGRLRIPGSFSVDPDRTVRVHFKPRSGACSDDCVAVDVTSSLSDWGATFYGGKLIRYHYFSATIPASQGVSSFNVEIIDSGDSALYDNGGNGFPFDDTVLVQEDLSCIGDEVTGGSPITIITAVRDDGQFDTVKATFFEPIPATSLVPQLTPQTVELTKSEAIPGTNYTLWKGEYLTSTVGTGLLLAYDVVASNSENTVASKFHFAVGPKLLGSLDGCSAA
ncbi:heme peroxidase [Thozetella sp. PMI_491]|nr:heme peroxidase [Thozetella sp. PMI_491]